MAKISVDVNHNPTKKGIKIQFTIPKGTDNDTKAGITRKLQSRLAQGLSQHGLTVNQDPDVPYDDIIGFLIPIADLKEFISNAIEPKKDSDNTPV